MVVFKKKKIIFKRGLVALLLLITLSIIATFLYIDNQVSHRLVARTGDEAPSILTAPFLLHAKNGYSTAKLRQILLDRGYRESTTTIEQPGEFTLKEDILKLHTRAFISASGTEIPSQQIQYDTIQDIILENGSINRHSIQLEPQRIAYLATGNLEVRKLKPLHQIPLSLQQAVIAIEDQRFYDHHGIDIIGVGRALYENIKALRIVQGGSTLTQQLAKNLLFSPEKTLGRKILEAFAAISLEIRLEKKEILELYLNEVYLGQEGAIALHGVESAATSFFRKPVEEISLGEAATLAGIIRAPSYYSPRRYPKRAENRKKVVLQSMLQQGIITQKELQQNHQQKVHIVAKQHYRRKAPYYISALKKELHSQMNLNAAIVTQSNVYTGFNQEMQECAEQVMKSGLAQLDKQVTAAKRKTLQGALVALEPYSGLVKAWVGGRDFSQNQFDRVSQGVRQIGSTVKPFLYLAALDQNLNSYRTATPRSILSDRPLEIETEDHQLWSPENFDQSFRGDVTLRYALEHSLNIPAVSVSQKIGIASLGNLLKQLELKEKILPLPALALGAIETSLLRLTAAYAALANGGIYVQPRLFRSVLDSTGSLLHESTIHETRVADENAVYVLTNILQGVIQRGTAKNIRKTGYTHSAAGKTGTSNDSRDVWFIGYTPNIVVGVWIGFDDGTPLHLTGGSAAAPLWGSFMRCIEPYHESLSFLKPNGVIQLTLDSVSGKPATRGCPKQQLIEEVFVVGTEPRSLCTLHSTPDSEVGKDYQPKQKRRRERGLWDILFG